MKIGKEILSNYYHRTKIFQNKAKDQIRTMRLSGIGCIVSFGTLRGKGRKNGNFNCLSFT